MPLRANTRRGPSARRAGRVPCDRRVGLIENSLLLLVKAEYRGAIAESHRGHAHGDLLPIAAIPEPRVTGRIMNVIHYTTFRRCQWHCKILTPAAFKKSVCVMG